MLKPLGLPPGSVRALLLLGLVARTVLDLKDGLVPDPWLWVATLMCGAAYFAARAAGGPGAPPIGPRPRPPLGLPAGTVRLLLLAGAGYALVLLYDRVAPDDLAPHRAPVLWLLGAFALGVVVRLLARRLGRPRDLGTHWGWHLQALAVLISVGGLVAIGATGRQNDVAEWIQVLLAAGPVYYLATR